MVEYTFTIKTLSGQLIMFESDTPALSKQQIINQLVEMGVYTKHQGYYLYIVKHNKNDEKDEKDEKKYKCDDLLYTFVQFPRFVIQYLDIKKEFLICHECMGKDCVEKHCNYSILRLDKSEFIRQPVYDENTKTIKYIYDYQFCPYDFFQIDESSYDLEYNHIWFEWDEKDGDDNVFEERCKALGFKYPLPRVPSKFGNVFKLLQFYEEEDNACRRCYQRKKNMNIGQFIDEFTTHVSGSPYVFQSSNSIKQTLYYLLKEEEKECSEYKECSEWLDCLHKKL